MNAQLESARSSLTQLQAEYNTVSAEPSDAALDKELAELEKSVPQAEKKLNGLKDGKDAVSVDEVDRLQRQFNLYVGEWKKRKKGAKEILNIVAEGAAKSWKEKKFCVSPPPTHPTLSIPYIPTIHPFVPCSPLLPLSSVADAWVQEELGVETDEERKVKLDDHVALMKDVAPAAKTAIKKAGK